MPGASGGAGRTPGTPPARRLLHLTVGCARRAGAPAGAGRRRTHGRGGSTSARPVADQPGDAVVPAELDGRLLAGDLVQGLDAWCRRCSIFHRTVHRWTDGISLAADAAPRPGHALAAVPAAQRRPGDRAARYPGIGVARPRRRVGRFRQLAAILEDLADDAVLRPPPDQTAPWVVRCRRAAPAAFFRSTITAAASRNCTAVRARVPPGADPRDDPAADDARTSPSARRQLPSSSPVRSRIAATPRTPRRYSMPTRCRGTATSPFTSGCARCRSGSPRHHDSIDGAGSTALGRECLPRALVDAGDPPVHRQQPRRGRRRRRRALLPRPPAAAGSCRWAARCRREQTPDRRCAARTDRPRRLPRRPARRHADADAGRRCCWPKAMHVRWRMCAGAASIYICTAAEGPASTRRIAWRWPTPGAARACSRRCARPARCSTRPAGLARCLRREQPARHLDGRSSPPAAAPFPPRTCQATPCRAG